MEGEDVSNCTFGSGVSGPQILPSAGVGRCFSTACGKVLGFCVGVCKYLEKPTGNVTTDNLSLLTTEPSTPSSTSSGDGLWSLPWWPQMCRTSIPRHS